MIKPLTLTLLLGGASMAAANGAPDGTVSTSRLQVQVPGELFKKGGYDHHEALFGSRHFGGSSMIAQNVYYTDTDLCDPTRIDKTTGYPSRSTDPKTNRQEEWPSPFILMANRGTCSFVQKARNAQHAGAAGLLIADNICLCSDSECTASLSTNDDTDCQGREPIIADEDGSGGDVTIPTFLMFKQDAETIKAEVKDRDSIVQIEMSWSIPHPDFKVQYELWTFPTDKVFRDFQQDWKDVAVKMGDKLYFTPRQYVYDGFKASCRKDGENMCFNLCTNKGRYCAADPDGDLEHGISGADVVREALRRICIRYVYGESDGLGTTYYWDYIADFITRCDSDDFFASEDCVKDAFKHAKIDKKRIDGCMGDSGGTESDMVNNLLEREIDAATRKGVLVLPTLLVNSVPLRGALTTTNVFNFVCAGFAQGSEPSLCSKCYGCSDIGQCIKEADRKSDNNQGKIWECDNAGCGDGDDGNGNDGDGNDGNAFGVSKEFFGMTLLIVCSVFGAAGYWHFRKPIDREEMRDQGRGILAEDIVLATINRKQEKEQEQEHQPFQ